MPVANALKTSLVALLIVPAVALAATPRTGSTVDRADTVTVTLAAGEDTTGWQ
ncbi:hypothetical protein ABTY96_31505 [Streptomyces sp. NPDC096057]|uniref:hypothetical protein n=1 Tax=Streptomyces sp. NPDC096057 TaxID=3155543 RepID=UPI00332B9D18